MEIKQEQLEKVFLETITPEFPEVERTEESEKEFQEMIYDSFFKNLTRREKRMYMNKEYKFSNQVRKQLNKKK